MDVHFQRDKCKGLLRLDFALQGMADYLDQEMTPCDTLISICSESSDSSSSPGRDSSLDRLSFGKKEVGSLTSQSVEALPGASGNLGVSSLTDLDSPMSCEQTLEDLPDSGFYICDSSDKMFTTTETQPFASNANDSGEWVIVERTTASVTTPSESMGYKDTLEGA